MGRFEKTLSRVLRGTANANVVTNGLADELGESASETADEDRPNRPLTEE